MIPADNTESCDQLKFPAKPSCSAQDSTEVTVETLNPSNTSRGLAESREVEDPEVMSSPEKPKSPQRLKKAGLDDPMSPPSPSN
jgi:hypothetical protein